MSFMYLDNFFEYHKNDSFETLIKLRMELIKHIRHYELTKEKPPKFPNNIDVHSEKFNNWVKEYAIFVFRKWNQCSPSPEAMYKYHKQYLRAIDKLLKEKYPNRKGEMNMSMPDPQSYIEDLKDEPYEKLIKVRDKIIKEIKHFEKHKEKTMQNDKYQIHPSPDTVYWWNLKALGHLCELMSEKFNEEDEANC